VRRISDSHANRIYTPLRDDSLGGGSPLSAMESFVKNLDFTAMPATFNRPSLQLSQLPWHIILPSAVVSYLTLVQVLRFRAFRQMHRKYAAYIDNPYSLNYKQAQEISQLALLYDTPFLFGFGTQWALMKSYGIATGTPLLVKTRQLADNTKVGRRAEDTAIMLGEFLAGDLDSERGRLVMSKLNWLHRRFPILEGDYVHTLSLFVLEPQDWIDKYEWRSLTYLEKVAYFIYWREIGHRMGFGGIPETLEDLREWKIEYEKTHLYYIKENWIVADATLNLFLRNVPKALQGFIRSLFLSFIVEKNVRDALGYEEAPAWATFTTHTFFRLRGFVIRHLFLPRMKKLNPLAKEGPDGRLYRDADYMGFEPWYVSDTWYNRFLVWVRSNGTMKPGKHFRSGGYLPEELGPAGLEKVSREPVRKQAMAMEEYVNKGGSAGTGCPFNFGW
jgi:hypothetical protein